jgi:hypothetical protein
VSAVKQGAASVSIAITCILPRGEAVGNRMAVANRWALLASAWFTGACLASQIDIPGPPGSVGFGSAVAVLPGGNIVVTAPSSSPSAAYLYDPGGNLISALSGDIVGDGGIIVLPSGNYLILSPHWNGVGAVTWADGNSGVSGEVSAANSLVGATPGDWVGYGVVVLANGNYVVASPYWRDGVDADAGAVTWGDGGAGVTGVVSTANSIVGASAGEGMSSVYPLANGNYVVANPFRPNGAEARAGFVTWVDGSGPAVGQIDAAHSLVGHANQLVGDGGVVALSNGNYVVSSQQWSDGTHFGATTWADGSIGIAGVVSMANSLADSGTAFALANGNYVVKGSVAGGGSGERIGAFMWVDGSAGAAGAISAANSLVGSLPGDGLAAGVAPLTNGNYVVVSPYWSNGVAAVGAVTWRDGSHAAGGVISAANSLVGSTADDYVGYVAALSNGNYVVATPRWDNGAIVDAGAVTWGDGTQGVAGVISPLNSLVGASPYDDIGLGAGIGVTPLADGNYVIASPGWNHDGVHAVGAVTWADGTAPIAGEVTPENSLIGTSDSDYVGGGGAVALPNGDYVVVSQQWNLGGVVGAGAITYVPGGGPWSGVVSIANSLFGGTENDFVGGLPPALGGVSAVGDGDLIVLSPLWDNASLPDAGAATLLRKALWAPGPIGPRNSVVGTQAFEGGGMVTAYDAGRRRLVVGRSGANMVSLFDPERIFADGFGAGAD